MLINYVSEQKIKVMIGFHLILTLDGTYKAKTIIVRFSLDGANTEVSLD